MSLSVPGEEVQLAGEHVRAGGGPGAGGGAAGPAADGARRGGHGGRDGLAVGAPRRPPAVSAEPTATP